jgi:hypothetical protein
MSLARTMNNCPYSNDRLFRAVDQRAVNDALKNGYS